MSKLLATSYFSKEKDKIRISFTILLLWAMLPVFGQLAQEPTLSPTKLRKIGLDQPFTFDLRFDGLGADGYLVLRSKTPITTNPVDGIAYTKGQGLGNAKVFHFGSGTYFRVKEVMAGTGYYFNVYAFNIISNDSSTINYLTTDIIETVIKSNDVSVGNYYAGIDFLNPFWLADLTSLINYHNIIDYDNFDIALVEQFLERDTTDGKKVIHCQYSNEVKIYEPPFTFTGLRYTREHRMAFSWINFTGLSRSKFEESPQGADLHALDLVQATVNTQRSNLPFGDELVDTSWTYIEFMRGTDARNQRVANIREDRKGDAARALMYVMLAYNGVFGENWGLNNLLSVAEEQQMSKLLEWHYNDPPDKFELTRHEYVFFKQGNRNPFIDFPELVDCIDFLDMRTQNCQISVGIDDKLTSSIRIFPQPATDYVQISIPKNISDFTLLITDINGKMVWNKKLGSQLHEVKIDLSNFTKGYYFLQFKTKDSIISKQLVMQ